MYLLYGPLFLFVVVDQIDAANSAETCLLADSIQEEGIRLDNEPCGLGCFTKVRAQRHASTVAALSTLPNSQVQIKVTVKRLPN